MLHAHAQVASPGRVGEPHVRVRTLMTNTIIVSFSPSASKMAPPNTMYGTRFSR